MITFLMTKIFGEKAVHVNIGWKVKWQPRGTLVTICVTVHEGISDFWQNKNIVLKKISSLPYLPSI